MLAIGDDVARGLGVVGALTIVRFRTSLKDSRDPMFVLISLASGVACGVQSYAIALIGTGMFALAVFFLSKTGFGSHRQHDAVLRLRMPDNAGQQPAFSEVLERHCHEFVLMNLREAGGNLQEHVYQVQLVEPAARVKLLHELGALAGLSGITLLLQDSTVEP